jgi:hypothetical protein
MHNSSFQEAKAAHDSLMSALAEFKASEPQTDAFLGAFGLAITFSTNGEEFTGRLSHVDGGWIETGPIQTGVVDNAIDIGRMMLLGVPA